ncbi:MAG: sulfotransferase [Gemmatimonadota bacterium]
MTGYLRKTLEDSMRGIHREVKIALTPLPTGKHWVFLVGCYNSGTTLLSSILATHPEISALPKEGQFLTDQFAADYELHVPRMWTMREDLFRLNEADTGPDADRVKREWAMRLDRSRPVFLEKSPPNAARTRWLQANFEGASFVALVRNGYAVAEGIRRKAEPHHLKEGWPLADCARQWARSNEILAEDAEHLDRVLWVTYEALTADPTVEIARILEFMGPSADGIDTERAWDIHERSGTIRDMNQESIDRLSADERAEISAIAGPTLERFGYEVLD